MKTVLITGANRGLGLEFSKQYANNGWNVIACCRQPEQAVELQKLKAIHDQVQLATMNVLDRNKIDELANELGHITLDLLIANAGIYGDSRNHEFGDLQYSNWIETLETNVLGVVKVAEAFLPHLKRSQQANIAAISSQMGSIDDNTSGGSILYHSSKASLNAVMKSLAIDLQKDNIGVLIFHPGWVKTDMGGPYALIDTTTSVKGMILQISDFKMSQTGQFIKYDGTLLPW